MENIVITGTERKIEFHPARKSFTGLGSSGASGDFQTGKKIDGLDFMENWLDPELSFGITFRKIGAGLENLGNTCFLNSVLQCLTYTEPLAAYLQSGKHQNSCHIAGFCALCAIQKHVSRALQSTGRSLVPKDLVSNLRCISQNFRNARQEDAHEYMVNLLESMHKCCLPLGVPSESPAAYERSLVHKIFGGRLRSQVECQRCLYCSNKFDPFLDVSLEIVKADSLPVALRNFTAAELLDGGEKHYQCQQCKQKVRAKKRLTVHKAPNVLTIHLKRFHSYDPGRKVDKKVLFDRSLDMKPFVSGSYEGDLMYSLYGVLVHFGHSTHSGHYVCFVCTHIKWYMVRPVSEKTVLDQKAYMLFYVRDRKNMASRKPVDVVQKENMKATAGSDIANLVFKQSSKEPADNGSVGNRSLAAGSAATVNRKDPLNFGALKDILQKEGLNRPVISECLVTKSDPSAEPSASSINSKSDTAKVENATVTIGVKSDCNETFSNSNEPRNSPIGKLGTNETSEKINHVFNAGVDTQKKIPRLSQSVDSSEKALNKIDSGKSPNEPSCKSSKVGGFTDEGAAFNSLGDDNGDSSQRIANELVVSSIPSVMTSECLQSKAPDCSSPKKLRRKLLKCRMPNMYLGPKLFRIRASLDLQKKKKHKKSKHRSSETHNLIKVQLESNCFLADVGPSTSKISMSVSLGSINSQRKRAKSHSNCRGDSLMDTVDEAFEKSDNQNGTTLHTQLKKGSLSMSKANQQDASVLDCTEGSRKDASENGMMCVLTQGLRDTTVASWDGIELPESQIVESNRMENLCIGYVPDEWDEEYDRGKRKKLRQNKQNFGGPNPFQEIASKKHNLRRRRRTNLALETNHSGYEVVGINVKQHDLSTCCQNCRWQLLLCC
ncbi:hypothetical protein GH714_011158 [Hevea brasiliensis]|uniref:Ubiquitin carboxyl-terminal hydrolase n=1 Tax=Hevea brasiliensis TaxID=3981 RepID=A0A6A6MU20_HEVBR|nr:hypothetical protein GH714_011158 [Hevea brasiliensis]